MRCVGCAEFLKCYGAIFWPLHQESVGGNRQWIFATPCHAVFVRPFAGLLSRGEKRCRRVVSGFQGKPADGALFFLGKLFGLPVTGEILIAFVTKLRLYKKQAPKRSFDRIT